jgi:ribosome-associated protein
LDSLAFARQIVDVVEAHKAEEIVLLDLRPEAIIADFFVILNGDNERHIRALSEITRDDIKKQTQRAPLHIEGNPESGWILMDYGDVVVHIFHRTKRAYYDLETLWGELVEASVLLSIQ